MGEPDGVNLVIRDLTQNPCGGILSAWQFIVNDELKSACHVADLPESNDHCCRLDGSGKRGLVCARNTLTANCSWNLVNLSVLFGL
jgi:hypothetical protein